jgi:hypothetical protein
MRLPGQGQKAPRSPPSTEVLLIRLSQPKSTSIYQHIGYVSSNIWEFGSYTLEIVFAIANSL